jgi:hypothetical protein
MDWFLPKGGGWENSQHPPVTDYKCGRHYWRWLSYRDRSTAKPGKFLLENILSSSLFIEPTPVLQPQTARVRLKKCVNTFCYTSAYLLHLLTDVGSILHDCQRCPTTVSQYPTTVVAMSHNGDPGVFQAKLKTDAQGLRLRNPTHFFGLYMRNWLLG